jgi:hypothetical protein
MSNTQKPLSMDIVRKIPKKSETEAEFNPYKGHEYRLFLIWRSLPVTLRGISEDDAESRGVKDPEIMELIQLRTLGDFAKRFGISPDTLTDWKKKEVPAEYQMIDWRYWAREFTPEVVHHLLEGIREKKKADAIKLWFQTVDGFVEETAVNNKATDALDAVADLIDSVNRKADASHGQDTSQEDDSDQPPAS